MEILSKKNRHYKRADEHQKRIPLRKHTKMSNSVSDKNLIKQGLEGEHLSIANRYLDILPNFIIIGAAKSATTTLSSILPRHPDIFISKPKEPKFFGRNYGQGWDWYASRFEAGKNFAMRGEASTMYTSNLRQFRKTPELMHRHLPNVKLIYLVRHPLDRIISQWRHYRGRHPNCANFNKLITNRMLKRLIIGCSMYYKQLSKFREFYPDNQIHCMTFEDLIANPMYSLMETLDFLGVEANVEYLLGNDNSLPRENEAGAKGRGHVDKPEWDVELKEEVLNQIKPDAEKILTYMGKPLSYWKL